MSNVRSLGSRIAQLGLLLGLAVTGWSQSDLSTITGNVKDSSGGNVPSAKISVRNEGTGTTRETTTNETGTYIVSNIPAGRYTVSVEANGFKRYEKKGNLLDANLPLGVDVTLEVGAISESVSVTAEASVIQTESATLGATVDQYQVQNLMLNGRNPVLLAALKPGVRSSASLANFNFNLTDGGFSMNGSRPNDNVFFYDGAVATRTRSNGTSIGAADVDSTEEVQVLTSNYNAEYGRSGGGQIRVITKSGAKDFHGTAYEFFRNSAMDANTWARNIAPLPLLNSQPQPLKYNQFGYNFSGPVYIPGKFNSDRNKVFFLFGQEWVRYRTNPVNNSGGAVVPSLQMRTGNFGELLGPNTFFGRQYIVADPNSGTPYPGNVIPPSALSPNGIAMLKAYPLPTPGFQLGSSNYIVTNREVDNTRKDTISMDVLPTQKDTVRLRLLNYNYFVANAFQGSFVAAANQLNRPNQTGSLNFIHVFTPTLINEALISASADHVDITLQGNAWDRTQYGVNYPYLYGAAAKDLPNKMPTININGFGQLDNGPYPSRSGGPIYGYSDNMTWIHGNHTIKFGGIYERAGQNDRDQVNVTGTPGGANNQNGRFDFQDTTFFGNSNPGIANLALGRFTTYAEIGPRDYTISRSDMFEFFVQDSWKVTSKLKLELGVRETVLQPYHALWGNYDVFDARFYDPTKAVSIDPKTGTIIAGSGNIYNGIVIPGSSIPKAGIGRFPNSTDPILQTLFKGLPDTYANWQKNNFVPRIGVAYQVGTKTVVRAGIGGFKNRPAVSDATFLGGNFPFQGYVAVSNGSVDNPGTASGGTPTQFIQTQDPVYKVPSSYQWNA
ncbi:MAG TPA: carboxypeptidase-like regulatory domain-containing protein, partial [Bryobacteraceae bacterium]|nr:carboxypeptidase-like regulatory domain-containing protein [Bryobacteraceae bacterium]